MQKPWQDIQTEQAQEYNTDLMTLSEKRAINKALIILEKHLRIPGKALTSSDLTQKYLRLQLAMHHDEKFMAIFLDNQHRVIESRILFTGTIDGAAVYPRVIVRQCLMLNAAAVIIAHNHPSGLAEPSQADISITRRIKTALDTVDIRVLDHVIVGHGECYSFAEHGLI